MKFLKTLKLNKNFYFFYLKFFKFFYKIIIFIIFLYQKTQAFFFKVLQISCSTYLVSKKNY